MQPVEINAGNYYLRALRADDRVDDRTDLLTAYSDPGMLRYLEPRIVDMATARHYVTRRGELWRNDTLYSWAVAEPTTGRLVGEVLLKNLRFDLGAADIGCWTHPSRHGEGIASTAVAAVTRFGFGALDLTRIGYDHAESNTASHRVAQRCGFTVTGRRHGAALVDGHREDLVVWSLAAHGLGTGRATTVA